MALACAGTLAQAATPRPVLVRNFLARPVSGRVLVQAAGTRRFVRLTALRRLRTGSVLDASRGSVEVITAALLPGRQQSGVFNGGAFSVHQERSSLTDLTLTGGRSRKTACRTTAGDPRASAARVGAGVLRLLHGHAHGRFRTLGRYAAATVRGTVWTTTDRCEGTAISAQSGDVATRTPQTPLNFDLRNGQSVIYNCVLHSPVAPLYCFGLLTTDRPDTIAGHRVRLVNFGAGLAAVTPDLLYTLCIQPPTQAATPSGCTDYPFAPPDSQGFRSAGVGCAPSQAGRYVVTWQLDGVALGSLVYDAPAPSPLAIPCTGFIGPNDPGPHLASLGQDSEAVNPYVIPTGSTFSDIGVWLDPTGTPGQQTLRGVVYTDDNGKPGGLLAMTDELTFHSGDPAKLYQLDFSSHTPFTPGKVWIGLLGGGQSGVAAYHYDDVAPPADGSPTYDGWPREIGAATYANGPPNPFVPLSSDNERISLYLDYDVRQ